MSDSILTKFEAFLLTEKCVQPNTVSAYSADLQQLWLFAQTINKSSLQDINDNDIRSFLLVLKKNYHLDARSIARKISSVKSFYNWAEQHLQWPNHAQGLASPSIGKKLPEYLSEQEVQALLEYAHNATGLQAERNKIMVYLLYVTGARISELISIKVSMVSLDAGYITLCGKGNKERVVPLPQEMLKMLSDYIQHYHKKFTDQYGSTDYLFPIVYAHCVKMMTRQALWTIIKMYSTHANIKKNVSPHTLRHSLATHLLKNGAHLRFVQMVLGHEHITTVQIYTHVDMEHAREEYNKKHPRS